MLVTGDGREKALGEMGWQQVWGKDPEFDLDVLDLQYVPGEGMVR